MRRLVTTRSTRPSATLKGLVVAIVLALGASGAFAAAAPAGHRASTTMALPSLAVASSLVAVVADVLPDAPRPLRGPGRVLHAYATTARPSQQPCAPARLGDATLPRPASPPLWRSPGHLRSGPADDPPSAS